MDRLRRWFPVSSFGCFYCGVDSKPLILFLVFLIGSLVLATVFMGVSLALRGKLKQSENIKYSVFDAEERS